MDTLNKLIEALRDQGGERATWTKQVFEASQGRNMDDVQAQTDAPPAGLSRASSRQEQTAALAARLATLPQARSHRSEGVAGRYDALRRRMATFEEHLNRHAALVDELLGPMPRGSRAAGVLQEAVYLKGHPGQRTHGYFRCINRTADDGLFEITLDAIVDRSRPDAGTIPRVDVSMTPDRFVLGRGRSQRIRIDADLSRLPREEAVDLLLSLSVRRTGTHVLRIWIEIEGDSDAA